MYNDQRRVNVLHGFSLHNMTSVDSGMKLHLVLKSGTTKPVSSSSAPRSRRKPSRSITAQRTGSSLNSIEETPISWTYQKTLRAQCELFTTVTSVKFVS